MEIKLKKKDDLFFGCKIDSKLREGLATAKPGDRRYFEDPKSEFLQVLMFEEEKWIGKVIKGGTGVNDVDDIQRNIISILRRIAPHIRLTSASVKIFHCSAEEEEPKREEPRESGPYIDY